MLNRQAVRECAALGETFRDKITLGLFGLVAPTINNAGRRRWRLISSLLPNVWLKPRRLKGLRLLIDPADWSQTVIFDEVFLKGSYDLAKVKFQPDVIIDCGAHIGLFSLLARSNFPNADLVIYEPNRGNASFIHNQIAGNGLDAAFHQSAVSTCPGEVDFVAVNSHGGRLQGHGTDGVSSDRSSIYKVKVVDFCAELRRMRPASLLLKMDVEGEERNLMPAILPSLPLETAIFFETHSGQLGWRDAEELLMADGFRVEKISDRGMYCDGFACRDARGTGRCH